MAKTTKRRGSSKRVRGMSGMMRANTAMTGGFMRRILYENGISLVMFGLFLVFLAAQSLAGWRVYNQEQAAHRQPQSTYTAYLGSSHFTEAVFENWESEFLQMGAFVILTAVLRQKGSPESRPLVGEEPSDAEPRPSRRRKGIPWPVRQGGWILKLYENSLSLALFALFFLSFALHARGGQLAYNQEQVEHGGQAVTLAGYLYTSQFWFESFQNWQSEFLSVGALVVLAIFLRQKGSPESKPVDHPHAETGGV
jgi:hypothetical protein